MNTQQTIVITGANSGIGYAATEHFAAQGAHVIMACRNRDKAEKARQALLATTPSAQLTVIQLDVSDLNTVSAFAQAFEQQVGVLDLLINNAGIVAIPLSRNHAGHEMQMATNYLGAFALTGRLLPMFRQDSPCRIVNVSSLAHRFGKLNPDDLNWETTPYNQWKSYAHSKIAVMNHTIELNRRLRPTGKPIIALGAHPGFANTNIHQNSAALQNNNAAVQWFNDRMLTFIPTAEAAARPIILAAESQDARGGDYYGPGGFLEIGGKPGKAKLNPAANDKTLAQQLWSVSEKMTGVSYLS